MAPRQAESGSTARLGTTGGEALQSPPQRLETVLGLGAVDLGRNDFRGRPRFRRGIVGAGCGTWASSSSLVGWSGLRRVERLMVPLVGPGERFGSWWVHAAWR